MISVGEDEEVVEVCAEVISGELERSVMFTLTSADGAAIGQFACLSVCSQYTKCKLSVNSLCTLSILIMFSVN